MDIFEALSSINKVSLIAFFVTLGFLIYELQILGKQKSSAQKPIIPSFDPATQAPMVGATPLDTNPPPANSKMHMVIFILLSIILLVSGFFSMTSLIGSKKPSSPAQNQVALEEVQSSGIKIYTSNWQEIQGESTTALVPGSMIFVGIAMVQGSDIDKARIKVNQNQWTADHITAQYNNQYNVFYKPYIIKEADKKLVIEAQLYSKTKGWLSE